MEIKYIFSNGEETTIEVYGDFEEIILELDRNLYNNNHAETRRHVSLSVFDKDKKEIKDISVDLENHLLTQEDKEILYGAISKLNSDEKELLHNLYLSDHPITQKEYANNKNLTIGSVKMRIKRMRAKMKKYIEKK